MLPAARVLFAVSVRLATKPILGKMQAATIYTVVRYYRILWYSTTALVFLRAPTTTNW